MAGWGKWLSNVATSAVGEVTQLGKEYLDSLAAVDGDEAGEAQTTASSAPREAPPSGESEQQTAKSEAKPKQNTLDGVLERFLFDTDAGDQPAEKQPRKASVPEASGQSKGGYNPWAMATNFVEKSADMALRYLPDLDATSPEAARAQHDVSGQEEEKERARAATSTASQDVDPMQLLRGCRGRAELAKSEGAAPAVSAAERDYVAEKIDPTTLPDFEVSDEAIARCSWVASTSVGRRIHTARVLMTALENSQGEPLAVGEIVEMMTQFPSLVQQCSNAIAAVVVEELADVYAKRITRGCDWYHQAHSSTNAVPLPVGVSAETGRIVRNTLEMVLYAQCEIAAGSKSFNDMAQECFVWAKKSDAANVKEVKERSLAVRGDCYLASTDAVSQLEEALECVVSLFPHPTAPISEEDLVAVAEPAAEEKTETAVASGEVEASPKQDQPEAPEETNDDPHTAQEVTSEPDAAVPATEDPADDEGGQESALKGARGGRRRRRSGKSNKNA